MAEDTQKSVKETENKPEEKGAEKVPEPTGENTDKPMKEVDSAPTENSGDKAPKEEADTPEKPEGKETTETVVEDVTDELDQLKPGMVVRVHQKIREMTPKGDERERIQIFEGTIIAKKGQDKNSATITVRKVSKGYGIERIFPLRLPTIAKIEMVKELRVRRSKLYFIREKRKKKKRLKEKAPKASK